MLKKVACINDLSGVGRCSLTVALPILSVLKVQCCPLPTAILSSQTGYPKYTFLDFTKEMTSYYNTWKSLDIKFDTIYSGFLASEKQIEIVTNFINQNPDSLIVVDPVLGDNGVLYPVFDEKMCSEIKNLVKLSHITTPNLTEACILTNKEFRDDFTRDELIEIAIKLSDIGPNMVVITGIIEGDLVTNLSYDKINKKIDFTQVKYNKCSYSGTGDIFTSIITGLLTNGYDLSFCVKVATNFIYDCIDYTKNFNTDQNDGVMFEMFLKNLIM
jgi:pyridoxine kinase